MWCGEYLVHVLVLLQICVYKQGLRQFRLQPKLKKVRKTRMGCGGRLRLFPIREQNLMMHEEGGAVGTFSEMVFGFLEDEATSAGMSSTSSEEEWDMDHQVLADDDDEEDREKNCSSVEDDERFWEKQHQLLNGSLCRSSSLETKIRNLTKEALKEIREGGGIMFCGCGKAPMDESGGCRNCLMREVSARLSNAGYNSAICKSKWRSSPHIPSGEHSFLDVIEYRRAGEGEGEVTSSRVIIEINFRAEFEMAKGSGEYKELVRRLPEVFVGKVERLKNVIKILCLAAKKCMKEKRMHLAPWRKHRYMQAKWLGPCERTTSCAMETMLTGHNKHCSPSPLPKPRASMLTLDLRDSLMPNLQYCSSTAVKVG